MAGNSMPMGCAPHRLAVPVAVLVLLIRTAAPGAGANPAAAIAAAAGHPARFHLRADVTRTRDGQTETATLELAGQTRLERVCSADLCSGTWFDGDHRVSFGINGTPLPERAADDARERTFAAIASTAFGEAGFLALGGTVGELPGSADGQVRYRVVAPHGAELVAVADSRNRRLSEVELPDGSLYRPLVASVAGPTILYAARGYDRIVSTDVPIAPPAGPPVAVGEPRELGLLSPALPIVPCSLGGRRARCLLDTGTSPSAVTLDFAEQLGQEPRGRIEVGGLATYLTGIIDAGPLALGSASFTSLHFAVIPRARGAAFDVILGSDALAGVRLGFAAAAQRVTIGPSQPQAVGRPIPLNFADGLPYAEVRLGSRERAESMLVDTGDAGTLSIGYDEYRDDMELFAAEGSDAVVGLGGVTVDALRGELAHAEVGGEPIDKAPIAAVRGQHIGHVGYGFAARCAEFVVDLRQRRVECRPKASAADAPARDS